MQELQHLINQAYMHVQNTRPAKHTHSLQWSKTCCCSQTHVGNLLMFPSPHNISSQWCCLLYQYHKIHGCVQVAAIRHVHVALTHAHVPRFNNPLAQHINWCLPNSTGHHPHAFLQLPLPTSPLVSPLVSVV